MEIQIISFGKISEFIAHQKIEINGIRNTDELRTYLETSFPMLSNMKYKLSLNKDIVQENTVISNHDTIGIMPPFSGG